MKLRDLGEGALIRKIRERFQSNARVGIGDDAAVFDVPPEHSIIFCSDLIAENTHFLRNLHPPDSIAYKAIAANVSDVGAMGGMPKYFLISFSAPGSLELSWFDGFLDGVQRACGDFEIALLGGDSSSSDLIFVDVSMIGWIPSGLEVRRSGARPGDSIYVTGTLGGSALGLECLKAGKAGDEAVQRHLYPQPRHKTGRAVAEQAHAMIDISDGLSTDLGHILEDSSVSARIYKDRLPAAAGATDSHVLHGGEDYELIITASDLPAMAGGVAISRIGEIIQSGPDHQTFLIDGTRESVLRPQGWQHW